MPKAKTHKGLKKRVKVTGTGKVLRHKAGKRHLLSHKSGKRIRQSRNAMLISKPEMRRIKTLLGER